MALSTYAQLQESITGWLWDRSDLSGRIPDFIAMFEADANHELRVRQMEETATITLTDGAGTLPTDYLAYRRVYANSSPVKQLQAVEPGWAIDKYTDTSASDPFYFYISGTQIFTKPVCSSTLDLLYYQKIPALATNTSGNWLLSAAPGAYLYGALMHAAPFLDDDTRIQTWGTLRNEAIALLVQSNITAQYGNAAARIKGATP
jgi:hypothetical protein